MAITNLPLVSSSLSTPALLLDGETSITTSTTNTQTDTPAVIPSSSNANAVNHVVVHPLVLFHVLDHHSRRQEASGRVIGTLLGRRDGNKVEVTNCFAVPHAERGDEVAIGKDFNKQMLALQMRTNRKEMVVGWYASAAEEDTNNKEGKKGSSNTPLIADTSSLIHEFYAGEIVRSSVASVMIMDSSTTGGGGGIGAAVGGLADSSSNNNDPIHLVVDTRLQNDLLSIRAYRSTPVSVQGEPLANLFHEIALSVVSNQPETICLHKMILNNDTSSTASNQQQLQQQKNKEEPSQQLALQLSMEKLYELLDTTLTYVDSVIESKDAAKNSELPEIGRTLADTLACVPHVRPEIFDKLFNDSLQDLLMVTHLSQITRTQLTVFEKLNETLGIQK